MVSFEAAGTETPTPLNPLGAKGIGESGTVGSMPAVQNAVVDALSHLGVRHLDPPLTPERVWAAIRDARNGTLSSPWREPPAVFDSLPRPEPDRALQGNRKRTCRYRSRSQRWGRESWRRDLGRGRNAMRYVEIVTGRARQRGIGGNHEASARQRAQTHLGVTAFHWNSGVVSASRPRRPGRYGDRRRGGLGSLHPPNEMRGLAGIVRVPPGNGGGPNSGGRPALRSRQPNRRWWPWRAIRRSCHCWGAWRPSSARPSSSTERAGACRVISGSGLVAKIGPPDVVAREAAVLATPLPVSKPVLVASGPGWLVMTAEPDDDGPWAEDELEAALGDLARLHEAFAPGVSDTLADAPLRRPFSAEGADVLLEPVRRLGIRPSCCAGPGPHRPGGAPGRGGRRARHAAPR